MNKENQNQFRQQLQNHIDSMQSFYANYKEQEATADEEHKPWYNSVAAGVFDRICGSKRLLNDFNDFCKEAPPLYTLLSMRISECCDSTIRVKLPNGIVSEIEIPGDVKMTADQKIEALRNQATMLAECNRPKLTPWPALSITADASSIPAGQVLKFREEPLTSEEILNLHTTPVIIGHMNEPEPQHESWNIPLEDAMFPNRPTKDA